MTGKLSREIDERLLRIRILANSGDKIHIKLPIDFVRKMVNNNVLDIFNNVDDIVDSEKLLKLVIKALDENISGEVAHLERKNGDIIKIILN